MNVTDFYFKKAFLCVIDIAVQHVQDFELYPHDDVSTTSSRHLSTSQDNVS